MMKQGGVGDVRRNYGIITMLVAAGLVLTIGFGLLADRIRAWDTFGEPAEDADLLITEICAKNTSLWQDSKGKYSDYLELYNRGDACNLRGFTISDGNRRSEPFGDLPLAAGAYYVLAINRDTVGFSLSASGGETITLYDRDGSIAAQIQTTAMAENQVLEWTGSVYELTDRATPGFPNTKEGYLAYTVGEPDENPSVVISELLTSNRGALPDERGVCSDVVELYNRTGEAISLGGYYLTDARENRFRFPLPAVILPAGGYVVVFCDGTGERTESGEIHANFRLSEGETVCLTSPMGKFTSVDVRYLPDDRSLALVDGAYVEAVVSLGFANDDEGAAAFAASRVNPNAALVISEVLLSDDGTPYEGALCDAVEIWNRSGDPVNTEGWYLTDGVDLLKYALPARVLQPGECAVVICDGRGDAWHANFRLSAGEALRLTGPDWRHGEPVICQAAGMGSSMQLQEGIYRSGTISLGFANDEAGEAAFGQAMLPAGLRISEIVTSNTKTLRGAYGTCCDWVELYNASSEPVALAGWYLTDDAEEPHKGALPDVTLAPGEYYVVFLSKDATNLLKGYPVLPFALSSAGDTLYLIQGDRFVDGTGIPALRSDVSYGRAEGSGAFSVLASVTPGARNGDAARQSVAPTTQTAQGVYQGVSGVDVVLSGEGQIYYTTDCTVPTVLSTPYTGPIRISATTVIRAICVADGKTTSDVLDLTYIVNEGHTLPVASLVTTPDNLWDYYTGIYATGPNAEAAFPHVGANYWQQWEKEATVSLFETDGGGFSSPCGIRIFGAYSRALAMKSFSCFFRAAYGNASLTYPLFGEDGLDQYEAFLFRNTGQDFTKARMRDPLLTELLAGRTRVAVQKNRPVVLYLNGEFWGVYYVREKINENYVAGNYNVSPDEVNLARANAYDNEEYQSLISYVRQHDLSDAAAYAHVCSLVDIEEYIDYIVAEIYICNTDNGNIKFFKTKEGKWTWIFYDVDQSFATANFNTVSEHLNPKGTGSLDRFSTTLINGLLRNPEFKEQFLRRMAWQIQEVWSPERVIAAVDAYEQAILPEMARDCAKWEHSYSDWQAHVQALRSFANRRAPYVVSYVQAWFGLSDAQMREYGFSV